jgi:DNA-binding MarR family transcriptional regulator
MTITSTQKRQAGVAVETASFGERLMRYFYPVHYQLGMEMEKAMSQGRVDRMQAAMLWLIHSKGAGGWVRRKEVLEDLSKWFELSEAKTSRLMRALSSDPFNFILVAECPESGRQKVIQLTELGERFVEGMTTAATAYLDQRLSHLSKNERDNALDFMSRIFLPPATP